jgi:glycosyltransferase involved in cell wall biosynthesis
LNLLYILSEFPPGFGGGIATVYGQLLPALVEHGHAVTILLADPAHCDEPSYSWKGVRVEPLQSCYYRLALQEMEVWKHHAFLHNFLPAAWAAWLQAAQLEKPDLVEVTDWGLLFVPWLIQKRPYPVVVSLHGSCAQVDWHGNPPGRMGEAALVRLLEAAILPLADAVIANSNLNAEFWWQQCGIRAKVIAPIASVSAIQIPVETRSQRGVVVGRLQNWKGAELLCKALRQIPSQQVDWIGHDAPWEEGHISTSTHLRQAYPDVVDHQLHLLGKLPPEQVQARISGAGFLCIPSPWDVFNVTALEAIAAGTPVLCSKRAGAAMLLEHGRSGYLFDPHQPEELANAIRCVQALAEAERQRITAQAMANTAGLTSPPLVASQHQAVYIAALDGFRSREPSPWLSDLFKSGTIRSGAGSLRPHSRPARTLLRRGLGWLRAGLQRNAIR